MALEIPGLHAAYEFEERTREEFFFGLPTTLCRVAVFPLSLRRLTILLQARSAFLYAQTIGPEDIAQFLWVVSMDFKPGDLEARAFFLAKLQADNALADVEAASAEIGEYLDAAFNDSPATEEKQGAKGELPITSFAAGLVDIIASEYGWGLYEILDAPLGCLYQLARRIAKRRDPKAVFISRRSIKARGDWLRSVQASAASCSESPGSRAEWA